MRMNKMKSIPAGKNPFRYDPSHMGTVLGKNLTVMYPNHDSEKCPYIILINTETGEKQKVVMHDTCPTCMRSKSGATHNCYCEEDTET